jgi:type II secretory pathway component GspD/PulD (secretin)
MAPRKREPKFIVQDRESALFLMPCDATSILTQGGSPTLTKRSLTTTVSVMEDELIILGGLTQSRATEEVSGPRFLSTLFQSKRQSRSQSEVLVMMQVSRVGPKNF